MTTGRGLGWGRDPQCTGRSCLRTGPTNHGPFVQIPLSTCQPPPRGFSIGLPGEGLPIPSPGDINDPDVVPQPTTCMRDMADVTLVVRSGTEELGEFLAKD